MFNTISQSKRTQKVINFDRFVENHFCFLSITTLIHLFLNPKESCTGIFISLNFICLPVNFASLSIFLKFALHNSCFNNFFRIFYKMVSLLWLFSTIQYCLMFIYQVALHLLSAKEKNDLAQLVSAMVSYSITYKNTKSDPLLNNLGNEVSHDVSTLSFDPPINEFITFKVCARWLIYCSLPFLFRPFWVSLSWIKQGYRSNHYVLALAVKQVLVHEVSNVICDGNFYHLHKVTEKRRGGVYVLAGKELNYHLMKLKLWDKDWNNSILVLTFTLMCKDYTGFHVDLTWVNYNLEFFSRDLNARIALLPCRVTTWPKSLSFKVRAQMLVFKL